MKKPGPFSSMSLTCEFLIHSDPRIPDFSDDACLFSLRGLLLIVSILLVGTGFTFVKHVLSDRERKLFIIAIPLQVSSSCGRSWGIYRWWLFQVLAVVAQVFLEEKEESDVVYVTWKQIFFVVDLLCCGAIIFPIVW